MADWIKNNYEYWQREDVESMYDKHLLNAEISLIEKRITPYSKILDAGCGEGEGTVRYASIPRTIVHAADFSSTRLSKAKKRLENLSNVTLFKVDFLQDTSSLDRDYDFIVSQRFLINIMDWELQKKVLLKLIRLLRRGGKLLLLEGSLQGTDDLNHVRELFGLEAIPVKWHNLFFDDNMLATFMWTIGCELLECDGIGTYFLLTRGIRPTLDKELNWDCMFNRVSASNHLKDLLGFGSRFSRLKLFVFEA